MRVIEAVDSSTQRAEKFSLTDTEIALSFSIYFTWGYPDYMREGLEYVMRRAPASAKLTPDRDLSWKELRAVIEEADSFQTRMAVATNPRTAQAILNFLAQSPDGRVVQRVAENANTHVATLSRLVRHHSVAVRVAVAEHPTTPESLLLLLARDADADLRYNMAENSNMPNLVLEVLVMDENPYVSARAHRTLHQNVPAHVVTANFSKGTRRRLAQAIL